MSFVKVVVLLVFFVALTQPLAFGQPDDVESMLDRAKQLRDSGDYEGAILLYDEILEIDPGNAVVWTDKGFALTELGRYEEALDAFETALNIDPDNKWSWIGKGDALNGLGRYEEALDAFETALEINPDNEWTWNGKGFALYKLGRYEEALAAYDTSIEINPDNKWSWIGKGDALYELGRYEEALAAYDTSIEINPDNEVAQKGREKVLENIEGPPSNGGGCLIATATFGSELAPQVQFLREIRDNTVLSTASGTSFMTAFNTFYYSFSPAVSDLERQNPVFKETVKVTIAPLITTLSLLQYVDIDSEAEMLGYGIGIIILNVGMYFVAPAIIILKIKSKLQTNQV